MKLLDAYCGAGLAALGYTQAGFECTGIDIEKKSCYAGGTFVLADALEVLKDVSYCRKFDAIHASPPCQRYSKSTAVHRSKGKEYPDLISETRQLLDKIGRPYVIENVPSAPIRHDIVLLGHMFGLNVIRKRAFELGGWFMLCPLPPKQIGSVYSGDFVSIFGKAGYRKHNIFFSFFFRNIFTIPIKENSFKITFIYQFTNNFFLPWRVFLHHGTHRTPNFFIFL